MAHDSPVPDVIPFRTLDPISGAVKVGIAALIAIGLAAVVIGAASVEAGRFWQALLFNWLFWSSLAMGMVMFAVALRITNADWAWSIRRFALGGATFLPISFVLLFVVLFGGYEHYFHHWLHPEGDPIIEAKAAWLSWPGLGIRDIVAVAILYGVALAFFYYSVRPDVYGVNGRHQGFYDRLTRGFGDVGAEAARSQIVGGRLAPILGLLYTLLWGMIGIDMAMSIAPHWFSTMFPVAFFWTGFHGGVAATTIAVALLRKPLGLTDFITIRQFHDLGKLVFAFAVFWMYLNWSQYIVIWYGLFPWEQEFFVQRFNEPFAAISGSVVILIFVLPFLGLLSKTPKLIPQVLIFFSAMILVGQWLERFLLIAPSLYEGGPLPLGLTEIGIGLGFFGLFLGSYVWYLNRIPLLPSPATLKARGSAVVAVPVAASAP